MRSLTVFRLASALMLGLVALATSCGQPPAGGPAQREASSIYHLERIGFYSGTTLGDIWVIDTQQSSGDEDIFRVIDPGDVPDSIDYIVYGSGPLGSGYSRMRVISPLEEYDLTDDYLYVSNMP